jgi:hypothetical protein
MAIVLLMAVARAQNSFRENEDDVDHAKQQFPLTFM